MRTTLKNVLVKRKALTATGLTAALAIVALVLLAARSNKPATPAPGPLDVQVVKVEQKDLSVYSEWIGTTDGAVNAEIKAQITGYLLHQVYKEGAIIKKGELLFEIDPKPFAVALDQANAKVLQFQGQVARRLKQVTSSALTQI